MTDQANTKFPDDSDPLSATAMLLRADDPQSQMKESEAPKSSQAMSAAGTESRSPLSAEPQLTQPADEFTKIFGRPGPASTPAPPFLPTVETTKTGGDSTVQGTGEFTRIFIKDEGAAAKPALRSAQQPIEPLSPIPSMGFSRPGASDAVSAETRVRPSAKPQTSPVPSHESMIPPLHLEPHRSNSTPINPVGKDGPHESSNAGKNDQSITSLIESLSSPSSSSRFPRPSEPTPYSPAPGVSYQPATPAPASRIDSGGVTDIIQRLSEATPVHKAQAPTPVPGLQTDLEQSDYSRVIAAPARSVASTPHAPSQISESAVARPVFASAPAVQVQVPMVPMPPVHVQAAQPAAVAATPIPQLPAKPSLPPVAAPKGKLEALVPTLLVVNTFLLMIILVVMIFMIRFK